MKIVYFRFFIALLWLFVGIYQLQLGINFGSILSLFIALLFGISGWKTYKVLKKV